MICSFGAIREREVTWRGTAEGIHLGVGLGFCPVFAGVWRPRRPLGKGPPGTFCPPWAVVTVDAGDIEGGEDGVTGLGWVTGPFISTLFCSLILIF